MIHFSLYSLILFVIFRATHQFGATLVPLSRCLANCASCSNDELTTCTSCVEGYSGPACSLKSSYIVLDQ